MLTDLISLIMHDENENNSVSTKSAVTVPTNPLVQPQWLTEKSKMSDEWVERNAKALAGPRPFSC